MHIHFRVRLGVRAESTSTLCHPDQMCKATEATGFGFLYASLNVI